MRFKVIVPVLLLGVASLVVMQFGRPCAHQDAAMPESATSVAISTTNNSSEAGSKANWLDKGKSARPSQADLESAERDHNEYLSSRTAELLDLAMSDDSNSLTTILSELNNPDGEIREAAIIATVQFKSAAAIPALQDAYTRADEPEEKLSIRKAIEFLEPASTPESVTGAK